MMLHRRGKNGLWSGEFGTFRVNAQSLSYAQIARGRRVHLWTYTDVQSRSSSWIVTVDGLSSGPFDCLSDALSALR
jgi:hypothetical protein